LRSRPFWRWNVACSNLFKGHLETKRWRPSVGWTVV
jgi:hypothetical protein